MALPTSRRTLETTLIIISFLAYARAHDHDEDEWLSEENQAKPIDSVLWLHSTVQILTWGFMFPIGMVLGLSRSKWHVPLQVTSFALTLAGYTLGHKHGGRAFPETVHGVFANILVIFMITQFCLGVYLKLHIHEQSIRPYIVPFHGVIGKAWPVLGWCQMLFGALTLRGYCMGEATGQCLAHYIMGSAFIGYGILLALAMYVGAEWLRRTGHSQEWFDSWVIFLWGIVNTFTEHRGSLTKWSHKDLQHTMLGVIWWAGGALGIYLSRGGRRSVVPGLIIVITGWAMSAHEQAMMISTRVHTLFGVVLMSAGLARIIEICFVLRDAPTPPRSAEDDGTTNNLIRSFQHLPPFLLVAGGVLFMSATDEELRYVSSLEIDHVTYTLIMLSMAFLIYLYAVFLIHLYLSSGRNAPAAGSRSTNGLRAKTNGRGRGYSPLPSSSRRRADYPGVLHGSDNFEMESAPLTPYADEFASGAEAGALRV